MATDKPRITITLEPENYAVLQRMAKAQGSSMARIVTELVSEVSPMLERVAVSLEAAAKAQQGMKASIRRAAEQAEQDMRPLMETALSQFDFFAAEMERLASTAPEARPKAAQPTPDTGAAGGGRRRARAAQSPRPVITGATNPNGRGSKGVRRVAK